MRSKVKGKIGFRVRKLRGHYRGLQITVERSAVAPVSPPAHFGAEDSAATKMP